MKVRKIFSKILSFCFIICVFTFVMGLSLTTSNKVKADGENPTTIAEVLELAESEFPSTTEQFSTPANSWLNAGVPLYIYNGYLYCGSSMTLPSLLLTTAVSKNGDNYEATDGSFTVIFNMKDGALSTITISGYTAMFDGYNGTFVQPRTWKQIVATCPDFPDIGNPFESSEKAWVNEMGTPMGLAYDDLYATYSTSFSLIVSYYTKLVSATESYYKFSDGDDGVIIYNLTDGVLTSIELAGFNEKQDTDNLDGVFTPPHFHTLKNTYAKIEPTCEEPGYKEYFECECGKFFADEELTIEIGDEYALVGWKASAEGGYIECLGGHDFSGPVTYTWNQEKCTATIKCSHDGCEEKITETVTGVYVKDSNATEEENEKGHYEATFTTEGFAKQVTEIKSVEKNGTKLGSDKNSNGGKVFLIILIILLVLIGAYAAGYFFLYRKGKLDDSGVKVIYSFLPRGEEKPEETKEENKEE